MSFSFILVSITLIHRRHFIWKVNWRWPCYGGNYFTSGSRSCLTKRCKSSACRPLNWNLFWVMCTWLESRWANCYFRSRPNITHVCRWIDWGELWMNGATSRTKRWPTVDLWQFSPSRMNEHAREWKKYFHIHVSTISGFVTLHGNLVHIIGLYMLYIWWYNIHWGQTLNIIKRICDSSDIDCFLCDQGMWGLDRQCYQQYHKQHKAYWYVLMISWKYFFKLLKLFLKISQKYFF